MRVGTHIFNGLFARTGIKEVVEVAEAEAVDEVEVEMSETKAVVEVSGENSILEVQVNQIVAVLINQILMENLYRN